MSLENNNVSMSDSESESSLSNEGTDENAFQRRDQHRSIRAHRNHIPAGEPMVIPTTYTSFNLSTAHSNLVSVLTGSLQLDYCLVSEYSKIILFVPWI